MQPWINLDKIKISSSKPVVEDDTTEEDIDLRYRSSTYCLSTYRVRQWRNNNPEKYAAAKKRARDNFKRRLGKSESTP